MTPQKVTVILLTYNHVSTISQSLKSILSQITTFKFNVMILMMHQMMGHLMYANPFKINIQNYFFIIGTKLI